MTQSFQRNFISNEGKRLGISNKISAGDRHKPKEVGALSIAVIALQKTEHTTY
jgi:hypothetical protein